MFTVDLKKETNLTQSEHFIITINLSFYDDAFKCRYLQARMIGTKNCFVYCHLKDGAISNLFTPAKLCVWF
jgi:hypothetical protein